MSNSEGRKKRGGQPGNNNALKHGFYSNKFRAEELRDLDAYMVEGVKDEITMLRVVIRRVMNLADVQDLECAISALGALGMAATRLAGLLKTQKILIGDNDELTDAINSALAEIIQEMRPERG